MDIVGGANVIAFIALTGGAVYYAKESGKVQKQQASIQEKQADLMERQIALMEAEQRFNQRQLLEPQMHEANNRKARFTELADLVLHHAHTMLMLAGDETDVDGQIVNSTMRSWLEDKQKFFDELFTAGLDPGDIRRIKELLITMRKAIRPVSVVEVMWGRKMLAESFGSPLSELAKMCLMAAEKAGETLLHVQTQVERIDTLIRKALKDE